MFLFKKIIQIKIFAHVLLATAIALCKKNWFFKIGNKRTFEFIFIAKQAERFTWDVLIRTSLPPEEQILFGTGTMTDYTKLWQFPRQECKKEEQRHIHPNLNTRAFRDGNFGNIILLY